MKRLATRDLLETCLYLKLKIRDFSLPRLLNSLSQRTTSSHYASIPASATFTQFQFDSCSFRMSLLYLIIFTYRIASHRNQILACTECPFFPPSKPGNHQFIPFHTNPCPNATSIPCQSQSAMLCEETPCLF
jgi:hypothetical protein